jgi:hypothetical protein
MLHTALLQTPVSDRAVQEAAVDMATRAVTIEVTGSRPTVVVDNGWGGVLQGGHGQSRELECGGGCECGFSRLQLFWENSLRVVR